MACPLRPPYRFDTKVESQIQHSEKPADSVNPENALIVGLRYDHFEVQENNWVFSNTLPPVTAQAGGNSNGLTGTLQYNF